MTLSDTNLSRDSSRGRFTGITQRPKRPLVARARDGRGWAVRAAAAAGGVWAGDVCAGVLERAAFAEARCSGSITGWLVVMMTMSIRFCSFCISLCAMGFDVMVIYDISIDLFRNDAMIYYYTGNSLLRDKAAPSGIWSANG